MKVHLRHDTRTRERVIWDRPLVSYLKSGKRPAWGGPRPRLPNGEGKKAPWRLSRQGAILGGTGVRLCIWAMVVTKAGISTWPCTLLRIRHRRCGWPGGLKISNRHDTDRLVYRCFLPDLTGFTSVCCVGPIRRPGQPASEALRPSIKDFNPA